ncbi:hypothetical protein M3J09_002300 [Ascochyta lentis]
MDRRFEKPIIRPGILLAGCHGRVLAVVQGRGPDESPLRIPCSASRVAYGCQVREIR